MLQRLHDALSMRRAYRAVFATPDGKKVLHDLCRSAHITSSAFTAKCDRITAYDNGARDLVLGILKTIHRNDEDLHTQIHELTKAQYNDNQPQT